MSENKWLWLAEVRAPAEDDNYHLSTGVPLSRRYMLTTAHGIPKTAGDKVQIRVIDDVRHGNCNWRDAQVIWRGDDDDDLDVVLLEIPEVEKLISFIYTNRLPTDTTAWEGAGFPAAAKIGDGDLEGQRNSAGLSGKFLPGGNLKNGELELTVDAAPEAAGKWAGISGAPVLCQGKLIGIIRSLPQDFAGKRFSAVPFWRLMEKKAFCEKLGLEERRDLLEATKNRAEKLLDDAPEVMDALLEQKTMVGTVRGARPVVDKLFEMDIEKLGKTCNWARKSKHIAKETYQHLLDKLLNLILPHLLNYEAVAGNRQFIESGVLVRLPVKTRTIAEIFMAGADRRPSRFRQPVLGDNYPVGTNLIEPPPEMGFSAKPEIQVAAFEKMLKEKYVAEEDLSGNLSDSDIRKLIDATLKYLSDIPEGDQHRYYYICNDVESPLMQQVIGILKSYYDQIVFITLDGNALIEERSWAMPLRDIYRTKPGDEKQ